MVLRSLRVATVVSVVLALSACSGDDTPASDAVDGAALDAGPGEVGPTEDAATGDGGTDGASDVRDGDLDVAVADGSDGAPDDVTPPASITTLSATATGLSSIHLAWTAVGDDGTTGTATSYDIRMATTPIANAADFAAATLVPNAPLPAIAGTPQALDVNFLLSGTTYYFAIRAKDEVPNAGALAASVSATTTAKAKLLITEVAPSNTAAEGYDFIELVVVSGGRTDGLTIRDASTALYAFASGTVATGDRVVVHVGAPCVVASGCVQEDVAGSSVASTEPNASAVAWDVYSAAAGIAAPDATLSVRDGVVIVDAIALSNRDGDASAASMTGFAELANENAWVFGASPLDTVNDCAVQRACASVATATTTCGGYAVAAAGVSLQRSGTTDTNTKDDFYAAPQTRGAANAVNAAPAVASATPLAATQVKLRFTEEIAPATATAARFTIAGLTVTAATVTEVDEVTLTTSPQPAGGAYVVAVSAGVTDPQGTALGAPSSAPFCGYAASPTTLVINEIAPNVSLAGLASDLVELRVTSPGSLAGIALRVNPTAASAGTLLATLPGTCVVTGDLVVVHLSPDNATGAAPSNETMSKDELPAATYAANYVGAFDVRGVATANLPVTDAVLVAVAGTTVLDAVALSNKDGTSSATFLASELQVQTLSAWLPAACGGSACTDSTAPTAQGIAASMAGTGTTPAGNTVGRVPAAGDTNQASDLVVGASTLGLPN
jgi:hypothetical protein